MLKHILSVLLLVTFLPLKAQNAKSITFEHEWSLRKFFGKTIRPSRDIHEKAPYVHSAMVNITTDLSGNILGVELIEESILDEVNEILIKLAKSTSGKWKFKGLKATTKHVNIILPFVQRTPPNDKKNDRLDLLEKYTNYHKGLSFKDIKNCKKQNCFILEQLTNYTGPPIR